MTNKKNINNNFFEVPVEVVSPVHIGGASEKNLKAGFDFFWEDGSLWIVQEKKLFKTLRTHKVDIATFADRLAMGEIRLYSYLKEELGISISEVCQERSFPVSGKDSSDLKMMVKNGRGNPILPGSSLKGSIRSVLFHHLEKNPKIQFRGERWWNIQQEAFGKIQNNLMRLLRIYDAEWTSKDLTIINTKVLSRGEELAMTWKHDRKGSVPEFDEEQFTTYYEILSPRAKSKIRIDFAEGLLNVLKQARRSLPPNTKLLFTKGPLKNLFSLINEFTKTHLTREIEFLCYPESHRTTYTDAITNYMKDLINTIPEDNSSCFLRLGSGVGFHGISGDWQFEHHQDTLTEWRIGNKKGKKTRRFAFELQNGNPSFYPFGFIKLG